MKGVAAAAASASAVGEAIEFAVFAARTISLMVFPAKIQKEFSCGLLRESQAIEADDVYFCHALPCRIVNVFR
ncbi:ribosomal protein S12 methylthiotransferase accessory factor YcaO [Desulfomicrobium macestii]|uniref:Ribosomal protein S12 methylthiotransferase accessory factor YcaO n=1 Tax=Desulfomicrobium macestii TaxID=90731 RepID=A0ABR9H827_9BACT|nr:ribosomal protein S12 methylthiotransferase accessory factor YcaO [Desulfomicrobium macestii]